MRVLSAPAAIGLRLSNVRRAALLGVAFVATLLTAVPAEAAPTPAHPNALQKLAAQKWYTQIIGDLRPLDSSLISGLQAASQWQAGKESSAQAGHTITGDLPYLRAALGNLQRQAPLAGEAGALADYSASVNLYVQAFLLEDVATLLASVPLRTQLQRSFLRIRQLGDVTYDVGTTQLAPLLGSAVTTADVQAARQLPDWTSEKLAPRAPLEASWISAPPGPSGVQSQASWNAAVRRAGAPAQSALRNAVQRSSTTPVQLSSLALALQRAEAHLTSVRGPRGNPQASARLRLGLLVDAEATLAAAAARLVGVAPDPTLTSVAASLTSIGGDLRVSSSTSST
jgi:hypothetical protein